MSSARWLLLLGAFAAAFIWGGTVAQEQSLPGVRNSLYENPAHGWILIVPASEWSFADAQSADGVDTVHLVSDEGDGADQYFVTLVDDGRGAEGCVHDIVDTLTGTYPTVPLEGWADSAIEYFPQEPNGFTARVRVPDPNDPNLDILAYVECHAGNDGILVGSLLQRSARDVESVLLPLLSPLMPGEGHTGRPRVAGDLPEQGVVRFLAREFPADAGGTDAFPFSCIHQETFAQPGDLPPPDHGWFACDGQIANIDTVPATIDVADLALGCASWPAGESAPPECPAAPVRPSQAEILRPPAESDGSVLTLQPGESAEVVLWYALPEGYPPPDILYLEPDREVRAGPTFFSAGGGSRPRVRIAR